MSAPSTAALPPSIRVAMVEDDAASRHALADAVAQAPDMRMAWAAASRGEASRWTCCWWTWACPTARA